MIKEMTHRISNKTGLSRQDIPYFILAIIIAFPLLSAYRHLIDSFVVSIWIINLILWIALLSFILIMASFVVLDYMFRVATEFSLLILLSQAYCESSGRSIASDNALNSLLVLGLLFIAYRFFDSLWKALKEKYKDIKDEKSSKAKTMFIIAFIFFTGFIIIQILMVVSPIINDSCVLKPSNKLNYSR